MSIYCSAYYEKYPDVDYREIFHKMIKSAKVFFLPCSEAYSEAGILLEICEEPLKKYGIAFAEWETASLSNEAWFDIVCETYRSAKRRYESDRIAEEDPITGKVPNFISKRILSDFESTLVENDDNLSTLLLSGK